MLVRRRKLQSSIARYALGILLLAILAIPAAVSAEPKRLDTASLKELLINLGYEPQEKKFSNGQPFFTIRPKVQGRTWTLTARAPTGRYLFVQMEFSKIADVTKIPQESAIALLKENGFTVYSFFFLSKWGYFKLTANIENKDVKPADIRKAIEEMTALAAKTEKYWNVKSPAKEQAENKEPKSTEAKKTQ